MRDQRKLILHAINVIHAVKVEYFTIGDWIWIEVMVIIDIRSHQENMVSAFQTEASENLRSL